MNVVARVRVRLKTSDVVPTADLPGLTPRDKLDFAIKILKDVGPVVEGVDSLLDSLIEMAYLHAADLLSGTVRAEIKAPQAARIAYQK